MSFYYGNSTILHLLWLWPTQHHMTQHCCLRLSESFHPNLVPFYSHSDGLSWWHLKLCVTSACICFLLSVRAEAAVQPRHRGRWKKRWRDNRVDQSALSGCREKLFFFFSLSPLGTQAKRVRSRLKCINALTSKSIYRCLHVHRQRRGEEILSGGTSQHKSAWKEHK